MSPSAPSEGHDARLFADPSVNGRVVLNFAALSSAEAVARIIAFGGMLYVARRVGAANYGVIAFVSGLALYLAKIADFGIDTIGTDEIAKRRDEIPRFGSAILGMRFALAAVVTLAAIGGAQIWLPEPERTVFSVFALTILPIAASTKWIHLGLEGALPIGVWRVAGEVLTLALIVGFVRDATHLWRVPAAVLVGDSLMTGMLGWLLVRQGYGLRPRWDPKTAMPIFVRALPVVGQVLSGLVIYNSSVVFLRVMQSAEAVGLYAAAYALISFMANICTLYGMSLLPTLARLGRRSVEEQRLYQTALAQVFAVTLPLSVCGVFVADTIIGLAFGPGYGPSARVLQVLVWAVVPYAMRVVPWTALIAHGHQGLVLRATGYAVGANIALNLALIYSFGLIGAAITAVVTECLAVGLTFYYAVQQGLPRTSRARFWRPVFAVLVMAAALWIWREAHVAWQMTAAATAYVLALLSVGGITFHHGVPALAV